MRSFSFAGSPGTAAVSRKLSDEAGYAIVVTNVSKSDGGQARYVAKYVSRYLEHNYKHLQQETADARYQEGDGVVHDDDIARVLMMRACERCQAEILSRTSDDEFALRKQFHRDGVTCVILMWVRRKVWVGILGDGGVLLQTDDKRVREIDVGTRDNVWVAAEKNRIAKAGGYTTTGESDVVYVFGSIPTTRAIGYTFQICMLEWLEPEWKKVGRARTASEVLSITSKNGLSLPIDACPEIAEVVLPEEPCSLLITSSRMLNSERAAELLAAVATLNRSKVEVLTCGFSFAGVSFS